MGGELVGAVTFRRIDGDTAFTVSARYVIDATELDDLLPLTGTDFVTGFESRKDTGEPSAPDVAQPDNQQAFSMCFTIDNVERNHVIDMPANYEYWKTKTPSFWGAPLLSLRASDPRTLEIVDREFTPNPDDPSTVLADQKKSAGDKKLVDFSQNCGTQKLPLRQLVETKDTCNSPSDGGIEGEAWGRVRQEAQDAFIMQAIWEIHCEGAFKLFLTRLGRLGSLSSVRHIRLNVFEISLERWHLPLEQLPNLKTVTFAPWQKGWTIDIPAKDGSEKLSDASVMENVRHVMLHKVGYEQVRDLIATQREYSIHFVFPIRYLLPDKVHPYRWQLKNWRANMDSGIIDREWREVYLVQEATLD
ncbi:hypothetical protein DV737_g5705, partial [Chaetothyriales sp. CBS 132003]